MPTRSRTESGLRSASRFVVAVVLVATLVACAHARAPKPPDDVASVDEHATRNSPANNAPPAALDEPGTSVFVRANLAGSEAEGLLRAPFLLNAAAEGACR